jgi:hypothetical protein
VIRALSIAGSAGPVGAAMLLPLAWIPLVMDWFGRSRRARGRPPTLLVLRVSQHDAQVQDLFDHVVERWRPIGNIVLSAGTDLADRTLDVGDIVTVLDGALAARYIATPADVTPRVAAFDLAADADGRFRVNECHCHDATWQDALRALVRCSDAVLMDLRGFQAHNAGCRFELATLAGAPELTGVVVLTEGQTDRAAAAESIGSGARAPSAWLDAVRVDAAKPGEMLASVFGARREAAAPHG